MPTQTEDPLDKPALRTPHRLAFASDGLVAVVVHDRDGSLRQRTVAGGAILRYRGGDESVATHKLPVTSLLKPDSLQQWEARYAAAAKETRRSGGPQNSTCIDTQHGMQRATPLDPWSTYFAFF